MRNLSKRRPNELQILPHFPMARERNTRQGFITEDQFVNQLYPEQPRHLKGIAACAFYAGGRASEWMRADWEDVDFDQMLFYFPLTKNKHPREVPIVSGLMLDSLVEAKRVRGAM